jgi:aspartyl-tRNA(Asn)/glutamyl-tRNA(Gln) amidotransferase subunit C
MLKQPKFNTAEATKNWKIKKINYLEFGNKLHLLSVIEDNQPINHPILKFCTGKQLKDAIKNDMEKTISFMDKLSEVQTQDVEPLIFMSNEVNRLREDIPVVSISHEEALKNAPKRDSDYFRIPKVLDK